MSTFTVQLQQFADKTKAKADDLVGLVVSKIATRLDDDSPVGDASFWKNPPPKGYVGGRFRGNWQLGIDTIPVGETGVIDPVGEVTLSRIIAAIPEQAAGKIYYLVNNVPYAQRIEEGWSRQAPSGLVALTAMEFQTKVNEAAGEVQ